MSPRLREVPVHGPDGFLRLAYAEWGSRTAQRTVVCVHGVSRNGRDFDPLAAALAAQGARVIAPDLPGRGRSDWLSAPDRYTDRTYLRAMATLIARLDVEHVDWVGTSLGGHIGMLMAATPRAPIRRLVLNDFGTRISAVALRRIGSYLLKDWRFDTMAEAENHLREVLAPFGDLTDAQWRHLTEYSVRREDNGVLRFGHDPAIGLRFSIPILYDVVLWHVWEAVTCPVLIMRGESSDLLAASTVAEMTRRGPAARANRVRAVEIAGCGHAPALMDADQIGIVREFLLDGDEAATGAVVRPPTRRARSASRATRVQYATGVSES